ncbi:MAG: amidase [Bryobacterales bacterium]|nr:amidase [Bryobacterales bacterium]
MARRLLSRQISPRELVQAHLLRIQTLNPKLNAFVEVRQEEALRQANLPLQGPLAGIPLTVKDSFDVAGWATRCGSPARASHSALEDSAAVARLRAAGAIILAKTNVPELVSSYETDNHLTGRTSNPWNTDLTPGGSSGGEAAAIAACCSPAGLGSDGGGSIRIPAHFCGIAGFKPTARRISGYGQYPPSSGPCALMSCPGPMARTVGDIALLFSVLQGADPRDSLSVGQAGPASHPKPRIGIMRQFYRVPVDASVAAALDLAASLLRDAGYQVEEFTPQGLDRAPNLWAFFFAEIGGMLTRELLAGREAEAHWTVTENLRPSPSPIDARSLIDAYAERERLRLLALEQMSRFPVLLTPPCSIPAFAHRRRRFDVSGQSIGLFAAMAPATIWNLLGFPALVLPCAMTDSGLPAGVQLVGLPFEDERLLQVGLDLEEARGTFPQPQL